MLFATEAMAESSWWDTAGAGALLGAGGVALGAAISPVLERRFSRRKMLEQAHLRAAEKHAGTVADVYRTVDELAYYVLGDEVGVVDPEGYRNIEPISHAGDAIGKLRNLRAGHPTAEVRAAARSLEEDLRGFYGNPPPGGTAGWPSYDDRDELLRHQRKADDLIELLHVAPTHRAFKSVHHGARSLLRSVSAMTLRGWLVVALVALAAGVWCISR